MQPADSAGLEKTGGFFEDHGRLAHSSELLDPFARVTPFLAVPSTISSTESSLEELHEWLPESQMASPWLALFYELTIVAILTVYSTTRELTNGHSILIFLSYFVIPYNCWFAQMQYDTRFQADDIFHKLAKLGQLACLAYLGAGSGGYDPGNLFIADGDVSAEAAVAFLAQDSFRTVSASYAASRALLVFQFGVIFVLARRTNRPVKAILCHIVGSSLAAILAFLALGLNSSTATLARTKVALFYTSIAVDFVGGMLSFIPRHDVRLKPEAISDRVSAITLIFLGEGFIAVLRAFNHALQTFSVDHHNLYGFCFACIAVLYIIYNLRFLGFSTTQWLGRRRLAFWSYLHFPYHFVILLLIAAMVNNFKGSAFANSVGVVVGEVAITVNEIAEGTYNPEERENQRFSRALQRLNLFPPWPAEIDYVNSTVIARKANGSDVEPYFGVNVETYIAQIVVSSAMAVGIEVEGGAYEKYTELVNWNTTGTPTAEEQEHQAEEAGVLIVEIVAELTSEVIAGVLWLFPSAGGVLILSSVLRLVRHDYKGNRFRFIEILQAGVGVCLALLGLLDLGQNDVHYNQDNMLTVSSPIAKLLVHDAALPIVTGVYGLVWLSEMALLRYTKRRHRRQARLQEARGLSTSAELTTASI